MPAVVVAHDGNDAVLGSEFCKVGEEWRDDVWIADHVIASDDDEVGVEGVYFYCHLGEESLVVDRAKMEIGEVDDAQTIEGGGELAERNLFLREGKPVGFDEKGIGDGGRTTEGGTCEKSKEATAGDFRGGHGRERGGSV